MIDQSVARCKVLAVLSSNSSLLLLSDSSQQSSTATVSGSVSAGSGLAAIQALEQSAASNQAATTADEATSYQPSSGFQADASNGQITLANQPYYTPEDLYTGLPEPLMQEYYAVTTAEQKDWQTLTKDVAAGNLQTAQADLASYEKLQPGGGGSTQDAALAALNSALATGDQGAAAGALATATNSLTNQFVGGSLAVLLAQTFNDAQSTPNWTEELTNFGGTLAPATMNQVQPAGDAFTQDLDSIQAQITAGTSGLANFLESQGYSSDLATADAQMVAYQQTVASLSTVVGDMANESNSVAYGATFEITSSLTNVGTLDGQEQAYTLSTDDEFSGNIGIKDTVTESELALTATGAIATAAVVNFGPPRPPSSTATAAVDRGAAAAALSAMSGYQTSFSVKELQSSVTAVSVGTSATQATVKTAENGATTANVNTESAWASVAVWEQKVDSYAAGKSAWKAASADGTAVATIDTSFESASHETMELVAMTMGSTTVAAAGNRVDYYA